MKNKKIVAMVKISKDGVKIDWVNNKKKKGTKKNKN